jgi:hypothetical protein
VVSLEERFQVIKFLVLPCFANKQPFSDAIQAWITIRYLGKESRADFGEEGPDDHVQLFKPLLPRTMREQFIQDNGHQERADR